MDTSTILTGSNANRLLIFNAASSVADVTDYYYLDSKWMKQK